MERINYEKFKNLYISYFIELKNEIIYLKKYIEFDKNNFKTFSFELLKLYQSICSEIDVIAKGICNYFGVKLNNESIKQWGFEIQKHYNNIQNYKVCIGELEFTPWKNWKYIEVLNKRNYKVIKLDKKAETPEWWIFYNKVKHTRTSLFKNEYNYKKANLENILNSFSALFILEYLFTCEFDKNLSDLKCDDFCKIVE